MPTSLPSQPALLDLSRQFGLIWAMLTRGLGLWESRERSSPLPGLAYRRASRLVARLQALLALLAAGRLPRVHPPRPPRPPSAAPAAVAEAPPPEAAPPRPPRLPRRVGWLMARGIEIRWAAGPFRHWLQDPQVQALLAQVPQVRRPLAALCRMLAIPPWPHPPDGPLPLPKPRVRKPRPKKPRGPGGVLAPSLHRDRQRLRRSQAPSLVDAAAVQAPMRRAPLGTPILLR